MVITTPYRVIYGDTDQMGIVYYANYLRLFELGRNEYMRAVGLTYKEVEEKGTILPVTHAALKYKKSAKYDDLLQVETRITSIRGARVHFTYEIKNEAGEVLVEGSTEHASVDRNGRVVRLTPELVRALEPEQT